MLKHVNKGHTVEGACLERHVMAEGRVKLDPARRDGAFRDVGVDRLPFEICEHRDAVGETANFRPDVQGRLRISWLIGADQVADRLGERGISRLPFIGRLQQPAPFQGAFGLLRTFHLCRVYRSLLRPIARL